MDPPKTITEAFDRLPGATPNRLQEEWLTFLNYVQKRKGVQAGLFKSQFEFVRTQGLIRAGILSRLEANEAQEFRDVDQRKSLLKELRSYFEYRRFDATLLGSHKAGD